MLAGALWDISYFLTHSVIHRPVSLSENGDFIFRLNSIHCGQSTGKALCGETFLYEMQK